MKDVIYDAIVVGTGISGGWAAKELCENGLKTLVLERGREVKHIEDYPTANLEPWQLPNYDLTTLEEKKKHFKQIRTGYTIKPSTSFWFVDDNEHPYNEKKRFDWIRGYHLGGRSIMWGRHSYRWSDIDFGANKKDGVGVDWPVRYRDVAPWYDKVESFIGVSGENLGLPQLPDGKFEPMFPLNCAEEYIKEQVAENYSDRIVTAGRMAHITSDKKFVGRSKCQHRARCRRGCPFGGYFSSISSTLPAAEQTGNMTLLTNSIAYEVMYDENSKNATGVKVIDTLTKKKTEYKAKVIFLCASAIASASILMQSKSKRFPNGMGNDSGELGHNIMDHHFRVGASGKLDRFNDKYYSGRKPAGVYIPRFRNLGNDTNTNSFIRGYGFQGGASRGNWEDVIAEMSYGKNLKKEILKPGGWTFGLNAFGEVLPNHNNKMTLDYEKKDQWGLPTVTFDAEFGENEWKMREDMKQQAIDILEKAGLKDIESYDEPEAMGLGIHEMGTARMGNNPKTSVLNGHNQIHTVPNVFLTDGSFMASSGCVNPSLTYMAFTARAANYAIQQLKKGKI